MWYRPTPNHIVQTIPGSRDWADPFTFSDGRYFNVENIHLVMYDVIDENAGTSERMSYCYARVIEAHDQCYHEIEVNFWPPIFEDGIVKFEDVNAQFECARAEIGRHLSTVNPQRGLSEYQRTFQLHFQRELILALIESAP